MEFAKTAEMVAVQKEYGSTHGYAMGKALAVPDVRSLQPLIVPPPLPQPSTRVCRLS
jgi:hypothetical protein